MGFAQNLDYLMQMRGMTKYQLAKELGCHQTSVTNWLENGTTPHKRTIEAVASVFGISANELCSDELPDLSKKENPTASGEVDETTSKLYNFWENASTAERQMVLDMVDFIKSKREKG